MNKGQVKSKIGMAAEDLEHLIKGVDLE